MAFLIFLSLLNHSNEENFREVFADHYVSAVKVLNNQRNHIDTLAEFYQVDGTFTSAIVFPELIRYSIIKDILERNSLEIIYVNTGKVDFSIGPLQIKPSFAEKIERLIQKKDYLAEYREYFRYASELSVEKRKERLQRLKNFNFQLHYVLVFQRFVENEFPFLKHSDREYKIRFLSTAYNYDFSASKNKIESYMNKSFFPWGMKNDRRKYNYSDISWYYYCHEISKICAIP